MSSKAQAEVEIIASDRQLGAKLAASARKFGEWSATIARGVGAAFKGINEKLKLGDVGKHALGNLASQGIGKGIGLVTEAADGVRNFERNLVRLQITANQSATWTAELRSQIRGVSKDTGVAAEEVLGGAQTYVDLTGDVDHATKAIGSFARIAVATGASVQDIATSTAAMTDSMHVDMADLEAVFSGLAMQGKAGAINFKDMASSLAELLPRFAEFKGAQGARGVLQMGAAFQVARKTFGGATEAATGLEALTKAFSQHAKDLKKFAGVDVFSDASKTKLKDFTQLITEMSNNKALRNLETLGKALGERKEAQATFQALRDHLDLYNDFIKAGEDRNAIERDYQTMVTSDAGKLDRAFNNMKNALAEAFTPERITAFADSMEGLADKVKPVIDALGQVADGLGAIEQAGEGIRGFLEGDAGQGHDRGQAIDRFLAGEQMNVGEQLEAAGDPRLKKWQDEGTIDVHTRAAKRNIATAGAHNKAVDEIMEAQGDSKKVTKEAFWAAMANKYATEATHGAGFAGAREAGASFLTNTKSVDNFGKAIDAFNQAATKIRELQQGKHIVEAIRDGFNAIAESGGFQVRIGDNQVAKSNAKATDARRKTH